MCAGLWSELWDRMDSLWFKFRRPAWENPKRRRCDLCRFRRTSSKVHGFLSPHCPRKLGLYGPLKEGRLREGGLVRYPFRTRSSVRYLCAKCRLRHAETRAAELGGIDQYAAWLHKAPLIDELPDTLVGEFEVERMLPGQRFVELVDVDYAAEAVALASHRLSNKLSLSGQSGKSALPRSYRDVARMTTAPRGRGYPKLVVWRGTEYLSSDIDFIYWVGSIYRWGDGRIVLHWHTVSHIHKVPDWGD